MTALVERQIKSRLARSLLILKEIETFWEALKIARVPAVPCGEARWAGGTLWAGCQSSHPSFFPAAAPPSPSWTLPGAGPAHPLRHWPPCPAAHFPPC